MVGRFMAPLDTESGGWYSKSSPAKWKKGTRNAVSPTRSLHGHSVFSRPYAREGRKLAKPLRSSLSTRFASSSFGADWEILALNDLDEETYATTAILDDKLYIR